MTKQQRTIEYNRRRADAVRRFRYRRKALANEMLGGRCAHCGTDGNLMFCAKDVANTSRMSKVWTASEQTFLAEIDRTILLCDSCFWTRVLQKRPKFKHGTMYGFYNKGCRCDLCVSANDQRNANRPRRGTRAGSSTG